MNNTTKNIVQMGRKYYAVENLDKEILTGRFDGAAVYDVSGAKLLGNIEGARFVPAFKLPAHESAGLWLA